MSSHHSFLRLCHFTFTQETETQCTCNNRLLFYLLPGQSKHFGLSIRGMALVNSRLK